MIGHRAESGTMRNCQRIIPFQVENIEDLPSIGKNLGHSERQFKAQSPNRYGPSSFLSNPSRIRHCLVIPWPGTNHKNPQAWKYVPNERQNPHPGLGPNLKRSTKYSCGQQHSSSDFLSLSAGLRMAGMITRSVSEGAWGLPLNNC